MTWAALFLAMAVVVGGDTQCVKVRAALREPKRLAGRRLGRAIRWPPRPPTMCWPPACSLGWLCRRPRGRQRHLRHRTSPESSVARRTFSHSAPSRRRRGRIPRPGRGPDRASRLPDRCAATPGASIGILGRRAGAGVDGAGRSISQRCSGFGSRHRRAGFSPDRRAAGAVLPARVSVPGHRAGRRRPSGRRVGLGTAVTADS